MMITDGQLLFEIFTDKTATDGIGVILGTGTMLDGTALVTACKNVASARRIVTNPTLNTYIKTTLARTVMVDTFFKNVTSTLIKGPYMQFGFSKATATPTVLVSGTPTWGILLTPLTSTNPVNGALCMGNVTTYTFKHLYLFSVGAPNSGADLIIPGDGSLTAGQIFRMNDIKIPINGLVC